MENELSMELGGLTEEQASTDLLLRRLLGTAVADRYADLCRLTNGILPLKVSRPLAGHALRELDSMIRHVLAVPLDARATDNLEQQNLRNEAREALRKIGFDEPAIQRADKALRPQFTHRAQIQKIVERLGLDPDGDIARVWISLTETYGRVHQRSFHENLSVDNSFREEYSQPFNLVLAELLAQLQRRYAALMLRAKEIAEMAPAQGIKQFVRRFLARSKFRVIFTIVSSLTTGYHS